VGIHPIIHFMIAQENMEFLESRIEAFSMTIQSGINPILYVGRNEIPTTEIGLVARCFKISCVQGGFMYRDYGFYETIMCVARINLIALPKRRSFQPEICKAYNLCITIIFMFLSLCYDLREDASDSSKAD